MLGIRIRTKDEQERTCTDFITFDDNGLASAFSPGAVGPTGLVEGTSFHAIVKRLLAQNATFSIDDLNLFHSVSNFHKKQSA